MNEISFTMPTPPSTNALFKNIKGRGRVRTDKYNDFILFGITAIRQQKVKPIKGHVVMVIGVERMSGTADIDNRLKAMLDVIVKAGVLQDDRFVTGIAVSWLPAANGLSHVMILPVQHLTLDFYPSHNGTCGGWFENCATHS